jgi:hypothetical protein
MCLCFENIKWAMSSPSFAGFLSPTFSIVETRLDSNRKPNKAGKEGGVFSSFYLFLLFFYIWGEGGQLISWSRSNSAIWRRSGLCGM